MKVLKWIIIVLLIVVGLALIIGLILPKEMEVSAEKEVNLPVSHLYYAIATFQDRQAWDPWLEKEPEAEVKITPVPGLVGSEYTWKGEKIGSGKMLVDSVIPGEYIQSKIWFNDDKGDPALVSYNFEGDDMKTDITWSISFKTANPFMRLMNQMFKGAMKKDFENGLQRMKDHFEADPPAGSRLIDIQVKEFPRIRAVVAEGETSMEGMSELMTKLFDEVMGVTMSQGIQPAGPPFAYYYDYDEVAGITKVKAGIQVSEDFEAEGVNIVEFESFRAISGMHIGPYDSFEDSYNKLMKTAEDQGYSMSMVAWEFYYSDPSTEPDASKWKTEIAFPLK